MLESPSVTVRAQGAMHRLQESLRTRLFGLDRAIEDLFIALMTRGHILLEDVPGVGKTTLAKTFAEALHLSFHRIQCTPDLLPADITGGLVFHPQNGEFFLRKGPVFTHLLLVDEINRALPRTQSALLEAMAEHQVTIDGERHALSDPFLVIATENPIESQGVFPLPEAQLDRFLMKSSLGYPSPADDLALLTTYASGDPLAAGAQGSEAPHGKGGGSELEEDLLPLLSQAMASVLLSRDIMQYISQLVQATRDHPDVLVGASPRAMIMLAQASRAAAVLAGRPFVTPDDVQRVATRVLFHRLVLLNPLEEEAAHPAQWMEALLATVEVPIERGLP